MLKHVSRLHFCLELNNVLLYRCIFRLFTFYLSNQQVMAIWVSASLNNAALNMGVKDSLESLLSILWGVYPGVELLDHTVILFLIF